MATDDSRVRARTPSAVSSATSSSSATASPATVTRRGPLTPPMLSRSPHRASRTDISKGGRATDASAPRPSIRSTKSLLRRAMMRAASSMEIAPATWAAAISPWLLPTTAAGVTPYARQTAARDTIIASSAGWITSMRSSDGDPSAPLITSSSDQSRYGSNALAHVVICSWNAGHPFIRSRPIPAHCAP